MANKTFEEGIQEGLKLYGNVCTKMPSCEECPIGQIKGEELTCQEFMKQFPAKMSSLLKEADNEEYTFFDEFVTRFPVCNLPIEELADICCRKAIFEGYTDCQGGDCVECWNQLYIGDVTEDEVDIDEDNEDSEFEEDIF